MIHVVTTCGEWNAVYPLIIKDIEICKVLGFDCEWVSLRQRGSRPVSLLQLATPSGLCVLIRVLEMEELPLTLRDLLADKTVLKMGVGCLADGRKLLKDHALLVRGCVDLRHFVSRARFTTAGYGLKALTAAVLGHDLEKNILIRASNWELNPLTPEQIHYAAMDALVGVQVFLVLLNRKLGRQEDQHQAITDCSQWAKALSFCQGIVDAPFSHQAYRRPKTTPKPGENSSRTDKSSKTRAYIHRQRPLYYNCQLRAPDGQLLCTCDVKKAEWYLEKGLGEKVSDDPLTIRLTFEPSGRPLDDKNYYLQDKRNVCVVCGKSDSYIRKNIVPQEYRKNFPQMLKEHKSHDVVLMCSSCHQQSGVYDNILKDQLARQCEAPLASGKGSKYTTDYSLQQVKSAANALLNHNASIPAARREKLVEVIKTYYGVPEISECLLLEASNMETKLPNGTYVAHGVQVVKYMMEHDGLVSFERTWRQHFLDTMKPQHLPDMWSVDHSHGELADMDESMRTAIAQGQGQGQG